MQAVLGAGKILGIDLSNDNVRAARQRFRAYENVHFQQDNLIRLSLPSESFDFVFCVGVLQVTEEPEVAFRELCRILKRGGRIYLGVYGSGGFYHALGVPFYRLAGKLIPQKVTEKVIEKCFPSLLEPARSLMDGMYVRIEQHYKISEIAQWFLRMGMQPTFLRHPEQPDTLLSRILFGEGTMIYFSAIKNGNFDRAS
jgi:ubiquinone/menaquinone biosynthesis C-methylase UbiE